MTQDTEKADMEFGDYNWELVAFFVGCEVIDVQYDIVVMMSFQHEGFGRIELHNNGGEINVLVERPVMNERQRVLLELLRETGMEPDRFTVYHQDSASLPYTSTLGKVSEFTLGQRLLCWLRQQPIDWYDLEPNPEMEF